MRSHEREPFVVTPSQEREQLIETRRIRTSALAAKPLPHNGLSAAVHGLSTVLANLERQRVDAERMQATAPVAAVLDSVLAALRTLPEAPAAPVADDQAAPALLTPAQAAERLGVSVRWLYRHAKSLPFVRRLSRRALRFDPAGLRRWVASRP